MEGIELDPLSIVIAAVLYVVINFFWYSKWLFGKVWSEIAEMKMSQVHKNFGRKVFGNIIVGLVIAYFLAFFEGYLNVTSVPDGMFVGFCLWLGFVVTTQLGPVIWLGKPIKLFAIDTGADLLSYLVMSGVIGA